MSDDKTEKISISMPGSLLRAVDEHIGEEERSAYFRRLATKDLSDAGKLPGTAEAEIRQDFEQLLVKAGPDAVREKLAELADTAFAGSDAPRSST